MVSFGLLTRLIQFIPAPSPLLFYASDTYVLTMASRKYFGSSGLQFNGIDVLLVAVTEIVFIKKKKTAENLFYVDKSDFIEGAV